MLQLPADASPPAVTLEDLPAERRDGADRLRTWLLTDGVHAPDTGVLIAGVAERLIGLGLPLDRLTTAVEVLHSEYAGVGRFWTREAGLSVRFFPHSQGDGDEVDRVYKASPFYEAHETGRWVELDLATTPDDAYGIVPELKEAGYRHYLCIPLDFANGTRNGVTLATRSERGFDADDRAVLRFLLPTLAVVMELGSVSRRLDTVLKIYVGDEPHRAILAGSIRRGQVNRIRSAILFADMRGYTERSSTLTPEASVALLNDYFDCLVPPIEAEGGEVLKYMGDGLLAIFRETGDDLGGAAQSALTAAEAALARVDAANSAGKFAPAIEVGIALHHGEAAYGNVGSGTRLDFTVIGRDVNLASRLAKLNKILGESLLMSRTFVEFLWGDPEPLGPHPLDGFAEAVAIYRPAASRLNPTAASSSSAV
jgi:adenylate cyclase